MTPWLYLSRWIGPYAVGSTTFLIAACSFFWPPEMSPFTAWRPLIRPHVLMKKPNVNVDDACGAAAPNGGIVLNHLPITWFEYFFAAGVARSPAVPAPPTYAPVTRVESCSN